LENEKAMKRPRQRFVSKQKWPSMATRLFISYFSLFPSISSPVNFFKSLRRKVWRRLKKAI
jgi:uncharacterized protein (DUF2132 family)